ncbi:VanZ family protein [Halosegnis sp.]|uniref:VanZ family protein n=1 Tax=Halosegnis sp. TaxID=2864959 RepID=UPI0035D4FCDC
MQQAPASRRYAPVAVIAVGLLVAGVLPGGTGLPLIGDLAGGETVLLGIGLDAWLHAAGYATLAATLARARLGDQPTGRALVVVIAAATGYGLTIELLQVPLATRIFALSDIVANAIGATLGTVAWLSRPGR